jgi:hypothetical protein
MQMVCQPKGTTAASYLNRPQDARDSETTRYFVLDGALPVGQILVMNTQFATLSLICNGDDRPCLLAQQQFTASELSLLLPLLELYPHYCPYEVIFASFYNGAVTEEVVARCRRQLQEALEAGVWDQQMRPVRNILSRVRFKMRSFGIDITSILETGYILMVKSQVEQTRPAMRASIG